MKSLKIFVKRYCTKFTFVAIVAILSDIVSQIVVGHWRIGLTEIVITTLSMLSLVEVCLRYNGSFRTGDHVRLLLYRPTIPFKILPLVQAQFKTASMTEAVVANEIADQFGGGNIVSLQVESTGKVEDDDARNNNFSLLRVKFGSFSVFIPIALADQMLKKI